MKLNGYYVGTDLKFLLEIKVPGFSMDDDDYEIRLESESGQLTITKSEIVEGEEGHYMLVDSNRLGTGLVRMIVTAKVNDSDFPKGFRREVAVCDLCYIQTLSKPCHGKKF